MWVKTDVTSLEEAFQKYGCWQTSESFTYNGSSTEVELVEQTAFIEILLHKSITDATITINDGKTVDYTNSSLSGNTYLAVPDGCTVSSSLFKEDKTIDVSGGTVVYTVDLSHYVDIGVTVKDENDKTVKVLWAESNIGDGIVWEDVDDKSAWPTKDDFGTLLSNCYWQWGNDGTNDGYYVFKVHNDADAGKVKNKNTSTSYTPSVAYTTDSDPYIFLPQSPKFVEDSYYWSSTLDSDDDYAYALHFNPRSMKTDTYYVGSNFISVRPVRRMN